MGALREHCHGVFRSLLDPAQTTKERDLGSEDTLAALVTCPIRPCSAPLEGSPPLRFSLLLFFYQSTLFKTIQQ